MWTLETPTEDGYYFFCGYVNQRERKLNNVISGVCVVLSDRGKTTFTYLDNTDSNTGILIEDIEGVWSKIEYPELPQSLIDEFSKLYSKD